MAAEDGYRLTGWETDLSSQTGASQAGILLGSNVDIPAFRWVEKETATVMTCSAPADCAELERRHATDKGLLLDGGASRGNLLSGQADAVILTVSRIEAEKRANPGYRTFFANGFNVTRVLVLFFWEVVLEWTAALRAIRARRAAEGAPGRRLPVHAGRDVRRRPRPDRAVGADGHDGWAARRVRDVLELRRGGAPLGPRAGRHARGAAQARPGVRAPLARPPFRAPAVRDRRPLRPRADPGSDVQAAQRHGLDDLVRGRSSPPTSRRSTRGDENDRTVATPFGEATGRGPKQKRAKNDVSGEDVVVLASGNLGLVYLMDQPAG